MFKSTNSLKDEAECVKSLIDFCTRIIGKHKYPDTDTRTVVFVNVRIFGYSTCAIANLLDSWSKGDGIIRQVIPSLIGLSDVNEKSVKLMGDSLHKSSKLSLILIGQFQIENCISNINKALGISSENKFYSKAKALIDFVEFGNNELDVLKNGSMIRNSLHSNGIHNGYKGTDSHHTLKGGIQYDFYNGEKVSCASLPHIAHALECSLEVLDEIISSNQIKSYTGLIEDTYVAQLNLEN